MEPVILYIPRTTKEPFQRDIEFNGEALNLPHGEPIVPEPGEIQLTVEKIKDGFFLSGRLRVDIDLECSRCLAPVRYTINETVKHVLTRVSLGEESEAEWSLFGGDDTEFNLAPLVRELILVSLPRKPLCRIDCRGLCPHCGFDLNTGSCECGKTTTDPRWASLADLIQDTPESVKERDYHGSTKEKNIEDAAR